MQFDDANKNYGLSIITHSNGIHHLVLVSRPEKKMQPSLCLGRSRFHLFSDHIERACDSLCVWRRHILEPRLSMTGLNLYISYLTS